MLEEPKQASPIGVELKSAYFKNALFLGHYVV